MHCEAAPQSQAAASAARPFLWRSALPAAPTGLRVRVEGVSRSRAVLALPDRFGPVSDRFANYACVGWVP